MLIRRAAPGDYDAVWEIFSEVIQKGDTYVFPENTPKADLKTHWFASHMETYVAEDASREIVGTYSETQSSRTRQPCGQCELHGKTLRSWQRNWKPALQAFTGCRKDRRLSGHAIQHCGLYQYSRSKALAKVWFQDHRNHTERISA